MMPLGTRVVPEDTTLEGRIAARLNEALDRQCAGGFEVLDAHGLADRSEDCDDCVVIRLSMADVARIAAQEARAWF